MKNNIKGYLLLILAIIAAVLGAVLYFTNYKEYAIVCFVVSIIILGLSLLTLLMRTKPLDKYERELNDILKTYDSVLAKANNIPDLYEKNIIMIDTIEDLVDIELEVRKPIIYFKQVESCAFILIDNDIAYIYIKKTSDEVVSPVEQELKEVKLKKKNVNGIDSDILNSLEKTEIIRLPNRKSYKVSPVRQKQQEELDNLAKEKEEPKEVIEVKQEVAEEPIETPQEVFNDDKFTEEIIEDIKQEMQEESTEEPQEVVEEPVEKKDKLKEIFTEDIVEDVLDTETEEDVEDDMELI